MLNLQRLFYSSNQNGSYYSVILPTEEQKQHLTAAKNKIRDHLREGVERASMTVLGQARRISPRFCTQGSWSYNTCNQPAFMPPQEMDWDLGHYLPISVWENSRPMIAAHVYYQLLEQLLKSLCEQERWTLCPKETCVRVQIGKHCHIDVPPYAAPDEEFSAIQERVLAKTVALKEARDATVAFGEMPEADWDSMKGIVLATRSGEWKPSDPGVVSDWFRHQVEEHGEQLRRICRYLKGWRDFQWREGGGPTSVSLMICACQSFQAMQGRDDLALLEVARELGDMLAGDIREELINEQDDFNKLEPAERIEATQKAQSLYRTLKEALDAKRWEKAGVLNALRMQFGPRIPLEQEWIFDDTPQAVVRAAPAVIVPQPEVRRTKSG